MAIYFHFSVKFLQTAMHAHILQYYRHRCKHMSDLLLHTFAHLVEHISRRICRGTFQGPTFVLGERSWAGAWEPPRRGIEVEWACSRRKICKICKVCKNCNTCDFLDQELTLKMRALALLVSGDDTIKLLILYTRPLNFNEIRLTYLPWTA